MDTLTAGMHLMRCALLMAIMKITVHTVVTQPIVIIITTSFVTTPLNVSIHPSGVMDILTARMGRMKMKLNVEQTLA